MKTTTSYETVTLVIFHDTLKAWGALFLSTSTRMCVNSSSNTTAYPHEIQARAVYVLGSIQSEELQTTRDQLSRQFFLPRETAPMTAYITD